MSPDELAEAWKTGGVFLVLYVVMEALKRAGRAIGISRSATTRQEVNVNAPPPDTPRPNGNGTAAALAVSDHEKLNGLRIDVQQLDRSLTELLRFQERRDHGIERRLAEIERKLDGR